MGNLFASQAPAFGLPEGEFVFVRHGFSCANALKRAGGIVNKAVRRGQWAPDSALTEEGKAQARDGAAEIVRWGEGRDASFVALDGKLVILTSPLRRAMQTGFELGATLAPRLGFDDFAIVPVTGLVEWPKSRMSDVGARSDDNIPYFRWGDDAEIAAKVPVRFQTAFGIARDENRNPVLADAFEGKGSNWRGYTFREGWEGVRERIDGNLNSVLEGDVAIVVSHHARMERYSEVEKRAKAAAKRCDTEAGLQECRDDDLCEVADGACRREKIGNLGMVYLRVPEGATRLDQVERRVVAKGRRAPDDIDLERLEAECGSKVAEALARRKEKIRQEEARTGEKDVEARRRFNDLLRRETEKRR